MLCVTRQSKREYGIKHNNIKRNNNNNNHANNIKYMVIWLRYAKWRWKLSVDILRWKINKFVYLRGLCELSELLLIA